MQIKDRTRELRRVLASTLKPNPKNWRTHPKSQSNAMAGILGEIGYADALIARELPDGSLMLLDGHLRAETTPDSIVPVLIVDVTDSEADKILLSLDPLAAMAEVDSAAMEKLIMEATTESGALKSMWDEMLKSDPVDHTGTIEDEVPEPPADPITQPGDLWILGDHRLLCGDSTKAEDVKRLMGGIKADLFLTDPPYNVDYVGKTKAKLTVENDSMGDSEFRLFLQVCFKNAFASMKPGAAFYIWHADLEGYNFRGAVFDCSQKVRQCLIWLKNTFVFGRQDYQCKHEPCLYGWKEGDSHDWYNDRKQTTILEFDRPTSSQEHPTMKPVALFSYQITNNTPKGAIVYDPFLGSGTTLIASEQLGRKCYGMEISPSYCDVIVKRWETLTGRKANRELNG